MKIYNLIKNKTIIRQYIRSLRHSLTYSEQYKAAQLLTNKILSLNCIHHSKNIGIFISIDGEIRTDLLIKYLLSINKCIYLPIFSPNTTKPHSLSFTQYTLSTPLVRRYLNVYEPKKIDVNSFLPIEMIDIIFIPLVAFDDYGNRLGMGGGFYDMTLQNYQCYHTHPNIIGLGYDFQKIPTQLLPITKWDIKLRKILTPSYSLWK